jgi:hypothetical protein
VVLVARDVAGGVSGLCPARCKIYVSSITGDRVWTVTYEMASGDTATITGINATGWWPRSGGELVDQGASIDVAVGGDPVTVYADVASGTTGVLTAQSFYVADDL